MQLAKCLALLCLATLAHSMPAPDLDPMIALPSDSGQQPEVRYVTYQPSEEAHVTASRGHQQPEVVVEYQVQPSERQMSAPYQLMQVALAAQQPEVSQEQQLSGRDYPGEIIYVNQSGASEQAEQQQQQQHNSGLDALAEHAGMSATILTEVPVRDMPIEVLNKLKREYGVKVVATRERPGANLVINCDEHSANVENSICARQQQQQQQPHELVYAYHQRQPAMEHSAVYEPAGASQYVQVHPESQEQPASQAEPQHVYVSSHAGEASAQELGHTYRGGEVVEVVHEQSAPGEQPQEESQTTSANRQHESQPESGAQNYYGARTTTASVAVDDSPAAVTQSEAVAEHEQAAQGESHSIGHESAAENVGFDEQPKVEEGAERTAK